MKRREPESEETDANANTSAPDPNQTNVATSVNPIGNQTNQTTAQPTTPTTQAQQEIKVRRVESNSPVEATQTTPPANTVTPINPTQVAPVQATQASPTNSPLRLPGSSFFLPNNARYIFFIIYHIGISNLYFSDFT